MGHPSATAHLSGFLVPSVGFDAKLGVIAYEGDEYVTGDSLLFGTAPLAAADALTDAENPATNFFNSSRTGLGAPLSNAGDLPQFAGVADTMGSVDFDVMDITNQVSAGQQSADIEATTSGDVYFLGAFVTSISTYEPNLSTSTKDVVDLNAGPILPGDELEYTITAANTGNDNAINNGNTTSAVAFRVISAPPRTTPSASAFPTLRRVAAVLVAASAAPPHQASAAWVAWAAQPARQAVLPVVPPAVGLGDPPLQGMTTALATASARRAVAAAPRRARPTIEAWGSSRPSVCSSPFAGGDGRSDQAPARRQHVRNERWLARSSLPVPTTDCWLLPAARWYPTVSCRASLH